MSSYMSKGVPDSMPTPQWKLNLAKKNLAKKDAPVECLPTPLPTDSASLLVLAKQRLVECQSASQLGKFSKLERKNRLEEYLRAKAIHEGDSTQTAVYKAIIDSDGTEKSQMSILSAVADMKRKKEEARKKCWVCNEPVPSYNVVLNCGCFLHKDCVTHFKKTDHCKCGKVPVSAVRGSVSTGFKKYVLPRSYCAACNENDNSGLSHICGRDNKPSIVKRVVPFPVIGPNDDCELWVASTIAPEGINFWEFAETLSEKRIYGARLGSYIAHKLTRDIYVYRVDPDAYKICQIIPMPCSAVDGRSMEIAVMVAAEGAFTGVSSLAFTGAVQCGYVICPDSWEKKKRYLNSIGINMGTSHMKADVYTETLQDCIIMGRGVFDSLISYKDRNIAKAYETMVTNSADIINGTIDERIAEDRSGYRRADMGQYRAFAADRVVESSVDTVIKGKTYKVPILYDKDKPPTAAQQKKMARNIVRRAENSKTPIVKLQPRGSDVERAANKKNTIAQFDATKLDYIDKRNQLAQMAAELRANATDAPMAVTGRSRYLRNILLPDEGAISIPDDVVRPHFAKSETVTANLVVADMGDGSGSGLLIIYPEHPTNLIAYHYLLTPTGYVYDQTINTAQDLKESFDYAKRGSNLLAARSATIPSGQFALNGTWTGTRIEGFLTEVPGLNDPDLYNTLLTNTVEPLDKVGNVLLGDGIATLGMTGAFGQPYTRLADATPYTITTGVYTANPPTIIDRAQDLQYAGSVLFEGPLPATGALTTVCNTTFNIDSTTGVQQFVDVSLDGVVEGIYTCVTTTTYFDPFGNEIFTDVKSSLNEVPGGQNNLDFTFGRFVNIPASQMGPLGAITLVVQLEGSVASPTPVITVNYSYSVPMGSRTGVNGPIVLAAYQGAAAGSTITVSGWANFNLIPNPSLRQNLELNYAKVDPGDVQWCRTVLADRRKFEIRSVWNLKEYMEARETLAEISDVTVHARAAALTFGDVIGTLKKYFLPALGGLAKDALMGLAGGGVGTSSGPFIGSTRGRAASGSVYRSVAASGDIIKPKQLSIMGRGSLTVPYNVRGNAKDSEGYRAFAADGKIERGVRRRVVRPRDDRLVAFPVLITHPSIEGSVDTQLYAASNSDYGKFHPEARMRDGAWFTQGTDTVPDLRLNKNVYLFPIDPRLFPKKIVVVPGPIVTGHSCDAAIWLVCHGKFTGVLPYAITGGVDGHHLRENDYFEQKLDYSRRMRFPLAGNDEHADVVVGDLRLVRDAMPAEVYHAV